MLTNILLEEAQKLLLTQVEPSATEKVELLPSLGRILAEDIYANEPIPQFNRSPLDGYAVRSEDIARASEQNPVTLKVIAEVPAGYVSPIPLEPGTAIKIMTGAPIPPGANAVIMKEKTDEGAQQVRIFKALAAESNIARAGEDVRAGEKVLQKGMLLHPGAVGMLAAVGVSNVDVFRKPKVAVLCTGQELVDVGTPLAPGKIYNSNLYSLVSSVLKAGGEPVVLGTVPDNLEIIAEKLQRGLQEADLVLSTGGASVGDHDLIHAAYTKLRAEMLFQRVAIKPGTPALAAIKEGKLLIGLSGNPAAALITFEHLVRPVILKASGKNTWQRPQVVGIMAEDFTKSGGPRRFLRAVVHWDGKAYQVYLGGKQSPGVLKSILQCNALIDVPAESPPLKKGQEVQVILLTEREVY